MTYDRQDLLIELRTLSNSDDPEYAHGRADAALLRFIDDEQIFAAYEEVPKWYA